jgi:uncharacterized protein (DUF2267 family)
VVYEDFIILVQRGADTSRDTAERATRAVLETLAERISQGEARDLAAQLPPELAPWIATNSPAERFDVEEFIRRVAARTDAEVPMAERYTRAVFAALQRAVSRGEFDDMMAELPGHFSTLLLHQGVDEIMTAETFLRRVADRAGVDPDDARKVADAVLDTLAERIAGGEVDDLIGRLPPELHPPLKRGKEHSGGKAQKLSLEQFLERIAERQGVDLERAGDHARAVLTTLREAVGDEEFSDVTVELPRDYEDLLAAH